MSSDRLQTAHNASLPWPRLMALGLGALKLSSAEFWQMTPRELERALVGVFGEGGADLCLDRGALNDLMRRYPDQHKPQPKA